MTIICRGLTIEHLKRFEHVRVIRGVLSLQGWDSSLPLLDFFRNVQYIGSEYFSLTTISTPGSSTALVVANNHDTCCIDLSNLRQIRVGNVAFALNEDLCYIGDFQTDLDSTYLANPEVQNVTKLRESYESVENCGVCNMYSCMLSMHNVCMSHRIVYVCYVYNTCVLCVLYIPPVLYELYILCVLCERVLCILCALYVLYVLFVLYVLYVLHVLYVLCVL